MNYIALNVLDVNETQQQILIAELSEMGAEGFEELNDSLMVFFPENDWHETDVAALLKAHGVHYKTETILPKNWNEVWESNFDPVRVGNFCGIRADFHAPLTGVKHEILITPKMSFGTGHHATTSMMVAHLENLPLQNATVVDYGTGTGILAILAEKEGAARVLAIDNDSWSIENAAENFKRNACTNIELLQAETIPASEQFDIVLANINKHIILGNLAAIQSAAAKGGYILLSGLLQEDQEDIMAVFPDNAYELKLIHMEKQWISLLFKRKDL